MKASFVFAGDAYLKIRWSGAGLPKLEREFKELLAKYGLEFIGSGYNMASQERDLEFRPPLPEAEKEKRE